jgi:hypothetical protein
MAQGRGQQGGSVQVRVRSAAAAAMAVSRSEASSKGGCTLGDNSRVQRPDETWLRRKCRQGYIRMKRAALCPCGHRRGNAHQSGGACQSPDVPQRQAPDLHGQVAVMSGICLCDVMTTKQHTGEHAASAHACGWWSLAFRSRLTTAPSSMKRKAGTALTLWKREMSDTSSNSVCVLCFTNTTLARLASISFRSASNRCPASLQTPHVCGVRVCGGGRLRQRNTLCCCAGLHTSQQGPSHW